MTLWNPRNIFSSPEQRNGSAPSASFDPSSTGDPVSPGPGLPSVGFGTTGSDGPSRAGDPQRNPIGFAPLEEDRPETRYSTELSFKRHQSTPRASATPVEPSGDAPEPWQTPGSSMPEDVASDVGSVESEPEVASENENTEAPASVPFYRREIGFGRKRPVVAKPVAVEEPAGDAAEIVVEARGEIDAPDVIADVAADAMPAAKVVPFYRREISLRRKPEAAVDGGDVVAAALVAAAVDSDEVEAEVIEAEVSANHVEPEPEADAPDLESQSVADSAEEPMNDPSLVEPSLEVEETGTEPVELPSAEVASPGRFGRGKPKRSNDKGRSSRGKKGRRVVGLKVGASQIAAAVVHETDAGYELTELVRRPLATGVVVDGEVRDPEALTLALKSFFEDEGLPRKDVRIGVSSNRIGVRTFDIVGMADEKQFDNAVRFRAHELLPVAVSESVLDYRVLHERPNAEGEMMRRVLLVVAPRDQVEPYARVANDAGLSLAGIDLEALALLRAFVEPDPVAAGEAAETASVVVSIGHESSTLLVAGGGACEFTRVFDWGGNALEEAIASALDVDQPEAATILTHLSLSGPGRKLDSLDESTRTRAVDAVRLRLTPFARELVNSLQFYQTQAESLGIGGIVVTGGASHLEGLDAALQQMIGVDVEIGDPFARVIPTGAFDPAVEALIGSMAVPIGLAIDDAAIRGVNLIPGGSGKKKKSARSTALAIGAPAAVAIPLVALGFLYLGARGTVSDNQSQLDAIAAEVASLPEPATPRIAANIVGDEAVRATAVASVLGSRVAWDAVFRDLSRVLPSNVWLQTLSVTQPETANVAAGVGAAPVLPGQGGAAPSAVKIDGFTYEQTDVARLLARLAVLPTLARVTLVSSEQSSLATEDVVHFVIVADLKNPGGAS